MLIADRCNTRSDLQQSIFVPFSQFAAEDQYMFQWKLPFTCSFRLPILYFVKLCSWRRRYDSVVPLYRFGKSHLILEFFIPSP